MDVFEVRDLYKEGEYEKIIRLMDETGSNEGHSEWDYMFLLLALNKVGKYDECLEAYKGAKKHFPESKLFENPMGWALYFSKIKNYDFDSNDSAQFFRLVDFVISHCDDEEFSPRNVVAQKAVDHIFNNKANNTINYNLGDKYLSVINPEMLSDEELIIEIEGKKIRSSSPREKWYAKKTKTLLKLHRYKDCITKVDDALARIQKFHVNNDKWLKYRKAKSCFELVRYQEAESLLDEITRSFTHWILFALYFDIFKAVDDRTKALESIAKAALTGSAVDHKLKVTFYEEVADYLFQIKENECAQLHGRISAIIRSEEGWKENKYSKFNFNEEIANLSKQDVLNRLNEYWKKWKYANAKFVRGSINKILPSNNAGFIIGDDEVSYYFSMKDVVKDKNRRHVIEGQIVKFIAAESYDKKKDRVSPCAKEIVCL